MDRTGGDPTGPRLSRLSIRPGFPGWLLAGAILAVVYGQSIAPDYSWGHDGVDGGDLITAAATGGVAHPSGYPTYLALAALFQKLPVGTLAFRTGLLSLFATLATAIIVGWLVRRLTGSYVAAGAAALLYGLAPLAWGQALVAEVYALNALLVGILLMATIRTEVERKTSMGDRWGGLALGLGLGNHLTLALMAPVWLWVRLTDRALEIRARLFRLGNLLIPVLLGLTVYGTLYLRALGDSPVNWGRPDSWSRLVWLVSGGLYREHLAPLPTDVFWARVGALPAWLAFQLGPLGVAFALVALLHIRLRSRRVIFVSAWVTLAYAGFAVLYPAHDSQIHLLPVILILVLWAGMGLADLLNRLEVPRAVRVGLIVVVLAAILWRGAGLFPRMDLSQDVRAQQFAARVLANAPENAILLGDEDAEVFTMWYTILALERRTDLVIVAEGLANYDWYRQTLRQTTPDVIIPELVTTDWSAVLQQYNDRPVCELEITHAMGLVCRD